MVGEVDEMEEHLRGLGYLEEFDLQCHRLV
jgi:hypothetical protein